MDKMHWSDIEIAPPAAVRAAGRHFAVALAETPQFKAFERAYDALSHDAVAREAITAYQAKVESLRVLLMLNAVSEAERAELEELRQTYLQRASVQAYFAAEADLTALCQHAAGMISTAIGLDYAAVCGAACCG